MSFSIAEDAVPALRHALEQLRHVLRKGHAHAEAKGWDPAVLLGLRLAPDMFALTRQVQIATDIAKHAVARLSDGEAPKFEDNETTFEELDARLARAIEYIASVPASAFEGAESRAIVVSTRANGDLHFTGRQYVFKWVLANVHFHCTTAYGLLRHAGVPLGKADYLGPVGQG